MRYTFPAELSGYRFQTKDYHRAYDSVYHYQMLDFRSGETIITWLLQRKHFPAGCKLVETRKSQGFPEAVS